MKNIIHPSQIKIANEIFGPSKDEISEASLYIKSLKSSKGRKRCRYCQW